jgi:hypothetical protein
MEVNDKNSMAQPSAELQKLWAVEREVLSRPLSREELKGFGKQKPVLPNPRPFIKFEDLNNKTKRDIEECNPKRPSVCVGVEWLF